MAVYRFHDVDLARPPRTSRPGPPGAAASESINSQIGRSLPLADAIPWWTIRARRPAYMRVSRITSAVGCPHAHVLVRQEP